MSERLVPDAPARLFDFLAAGLAGWGRNTLRERLRDGCVLVNGQAVRRGDHALAAGDEVEVVGRDEGQPRRRALPGLEILHEDEHLVAIDKPAGLLSVSTDGGHERTALTLVRAALSRPGRPARIWPVHRLDRGTSGVLLLARSREACDAVRARWDQARKTYRAIVEGIPAPAEGTIDQPLWEDRTLNVHVGARPEAKDARTHYRTLATARDRALLEVELETGRRHQIRVHLASLGHPIVGDERYGDPDGARGLRLGLHAWRLEVPVPWPSTGAERLVLEAPVPRAFAALIDGKR